MGQLNDSKKYLHQAITIFEALNKTETVKLVVDWCKVHYQLVF